ncbi:hypothetical protein BJF79_17180 [Actinomadura sp. CNU-125]|nr:hypothetical protein BJF79_17180 [Actinomadura sp. CNU-125]
MPVQPTSGSAAMSSAVTASFPARRCEAGTSRTRASEYRTVTSRSSAGIGSGVRATRTSTCLSSSVEASCEPR